MHRSTRSPPPSASRVTRCGRAASSLSASPVPSSAASAVRVHTRCLCISRTPYTRLTPPSPPHAPRPRRAARRQRRPQGQLRVHGDGLRRRRGPVRQRALPPCAAAWPPHLRRGHRRRALRRLPLHPGGGAAITARLPLLSQPGDSPACLPIHLPARRPMCHPPPLLVSVCRSSSRAAASCSPSSPASPSPAPVPPTGARCSPSRSSRASRSWARCSRCPSRHAGSPRRGARRRTASPTRSPTRSRTPAPGP